MIMLTHLLIAMKGSYLMLMFRLPILFATWTMDEFNNEEVVFWY